MSITDIIYRDLYDDIIINGEERKDRTGIGTYSLFGTQSRYDLREGFPILTTKKINFSSVVGELFWFLRGETNIKTLNSHIWDEWSQNIGDYPNNDRISGWVKNVPEKQYEPYNGDYSSPCGINIKHASIDDKLRGLWVKMMKRCYYPNSHNFRFYGEKGIFVSKDWHDLSNFLKDVKKIQNWDLKLKNWNLYELDKDYYGSNYYSKNSCVWLHTAENNLYIGDAIELIIDDNIQLYHSYADCEIKTGLSASSLHRWVQDGTPSYFKQKNKFLNKKNISISPAKKKGCSYRILFTNGELGPIYGQTWRSWNGIDQINELVNGIKNNPYSRRHIVSAWQVDNLHKMALPPCHILFQCYVSTDGHLDLQLYQRSADMALGVPYNIASYSLLLSLLAQECNLVPRYFIHSIGDAHIYLNHVEKLSKQMMNERFPAPQLTLDINGVSLLSGKAPIESVQLVNYQHGPFIKYDVAV